MAGSDTTPQQPGAGKQAGRASQTGALGPVGPQEPQSYSGKGSGAQAASVGAALRNRKGGPASMLTKLRLVRGLPFLVTWPAGLANAQISGPHNPHTLGAMVVLHGDVLGGCARLGHCDIGHQMATVRRSSPACQGQGHLCARKGTKTQEGVA